MRKKTEKPIEPQAPAIVDSASVRPPSWKALIKEAKQSGQVIAAKLLEATEQNGGLTRLVAVRAELLEPFGLEPDDCGSLVVHQAEKIEDRFRNEMSEWLRIRNTPFGEQAPPALPKPIEDQEPVLNPEIIGLPNNRVEPPVGPGDSAWKTVWGHPIVKLVRWMGSEDWGPEKARRALASLGISITDDVLRYNLDDARASGKRDCIKLTRLQESIIWEASRKV